jgi:hypothetical protein
MLDVKYEFVLWCMECSWLERRGEIRFGGGISENVILLDGNLSSIQKTVDDSYDAEVIERHEESASASSTNLSFLLQCVAGSALT